MYENVLMSVISDVNECLNQAGMCQHGRCINTVGSFTCQCQAGFILASDGLNCIGLYQYSG